MQYQIIVCCIGFICWYFFAGTVAGLTGLSYGRKYMFLVPFHELFEDFKCLSRKYKANYIKKIVNSKIYIQPGQENCGVMCSSKGSWTYKEIRDNNLYEKVGMAMLPGWTNFIVLHCIVPLIVLMIILLIR